MNFIETTVIKCFGRALGHLLKNGEGICVDLKQGQKFIVFSEGAQVKITTEDDLAEYGRPPLKDGQMLWVHKIEES